MVLRQVEAEEHLEVEQALLVDGEDKQDDEWKEMEVKAPLFPSGLLRES